MVNSVAVIGFPNSTKPYRLTWQDSNDPAASAQVASDVILSSASTIVANGTTTLRFTISVSVVELFVQKPISAPMDIIFATGFAPVLSYHGDSHAHHVIDLACLALPSPPPPVASSAAPCSTFRCAMSLDNDQLRMSWTLNAGVLDVILDGHTKGYIALGFTTEGWMQGSLAVVGWAGPGGAVHVYQLYQLSTNLPARSALVTATLPLPSSSVVEAGGRTQVSFSVRVSDIPHHFKVNTKGGSSQLIWAWSDSDTLIYHGQSRGTGWVNWAKGEGRSSRADARRDEQRRHGLIMFFAFGVFMPAAILFARYGRVLLPGTLWFHLHRAVNSAAIFVALIGFSYAIYQFPRMNARHGNLGWGVIAIMLLQLGGASYRPAKPEHGGPEATTKDVLKSRLRRWWEWCHRACGLTTLFLGLINVYVGLGRYKDEQQEDVWQLMLGFSVYIGVVTVTALVLELVVRRSIRINKEMAKVDRMRGVQVGTTPPPAAPL